MNIHIWLSIYYQSYMVTHISVPIYDRSYACIRTCIHDYSYYLKSHSYVFYDYHKHQHKLSAISKINYDNHQTTKINYDLQVDL